MKRSHIIYSIYSPELHRLLACLRLLFMVDAYFAFKQDVTTRGSSGRYYCPVESNGRVRARYHHFAVWTVKPWNSLPAVTINLTV